MKPHYIYIVRDGRDVAVSYMKAIVGPKHVYPLAQKWKKEQELFLQLKRAIGNDRFTFVRYEELIRNPFKIIQSICDKLQIDCSEEVLSYFNSPESIATANAGRMWKNLTSPVLENNFNKFKTEFTKEQILIFETIAGNLLTELGYENSFWPNSFIKEFTPEMINQFNHEEQKELNRMIAQADPDELAKRQPQESFLARIKNDLKIV